MFRAHYGQPSDVLVLKADHTQLNPTLDPKVIERAMAEDPEAARSEWFGEFRSDVSQWLADELIDIALESGRLKIGRSHPSAAFVDMSGGRHDASVLAIAHAEDAPESPRDRFRPDGNGPPPIVRLDVLHAVPAPHEPSAVVEQFAKTLKDRGLRKVVGDRYAAGWVSDAFQKEGIEYEPSELDKSAIYCEALPLFAERRVELLEDKRLVTELRLLERRPRTGGRGDAVDHPPRGKDDAANACCGALWLAAKIKPPMTIADSVVNDNNWDDDSGWGRSW
jgi:hypothetical protein